MSVCVCVYKYIVCTRIYVFNLVKSLFIYLYNMHVYNFKYSTYWGWSKLKNQFVYIYIYIYLLKWRENFQKYYAL